MKLKGSSWAIIADAGGGLLGAAIGLGIGGPILGAAASVAVNEAMDDSKEVITDKDNTNNGEKELLPRE